MTTTGLNALTAEEREQLYAEMRAQEEAAAQQRQEEIEAYKALVSQTVRDSFPKLQEASRMLAATKSEIREAFRSALELKAELYGTKDGQQSHSFMTDDGKLRIRIGYNVLDNYDDTAETGVAMVKEYLNSLGDSENAQQAVKLALSLLARNKEGSLKASRIMTLRKHALESGSKKFIEGVNIIMDAYNPIESKSFIRGEYKNDDGAWVSVPLGMTEA